MTDTHGDPADWDTIPTSLSAAIQTELAFRGVTIIDAHDDAIVLGAPGLDDGEDWVLRRPGWRGDHWTYGVATDGHCPNPEPLAAAPTDAAGIAAEVAAVLAGW